MPEFDRIDYSVVADRVAGQPGFDEAVREFVEKGISHKLSRCVLASLIDLVAEHDEEMRNFREGSNDAPGRIA